VEDQGRSGIGPRDKAKVRGAIAIINPEMGLE
jgi:hypothetical protein